MVFPVCFSFINVGPVAVSMIASVVVVAAAVLLISQCTVPGRKLVSSRLSPTDDEAGRRGQGEEEWGDGLMKMKICVNVHCLHIEQHRAEIELEFQLQLEMEKELDMELELERELEFPS